MKNESFKRRIINLNEGWTFYKDCPDPTPEGGGERVNLPHTWNSIDGQDGGGDYFRGACLYQRELDISPDDGTHYYVEFRGANSQAKVFLGDTPITAHDGGYSTFRADLTMALRDGARTLSVIVDNSPSSTVYPQMADFTFYGGLYRDVKLIEVPKEHIDLEYLGGDGIKITPEVCDGGAKVVCEIYTTPLIPSQKIKATLFDKDGERIATADCKICPEVFCTANSENTPEADYARRLMANGAQSAAKNCSSNSSASCEQDNSSSSASANSGEGAKAKCQNSSEGATKVNHASSHHSAPERKYNSDKTDYGKTSEARTYHKCTFSIENVRLWDGVRDPYLYSIRAELWQDEELIDAVTSRFGVRTFDIDPERGFILNGREYPLRGVSRHQDRAGIGNALLPEHHKEDLALICELGANAVRLAHYQHDRAFLDLCDEAGLVVWAEIPYISKHLDGGVENTLSQMRELIVQCYNHPSIGMWGLSNEISIGGSSDSLIENHKRLNELCHALDGTRKTVVAAVSMCHTDDPYLKIPDAVAYNHYFGWYGGDTSMMEPWFEKFHKEHPEIPIGVSEYGAEALNWHTNTPTQGDYTEEYQAYYHEEMIKALFNKKYIFATFVWNMFDFGADARAEGGESGRNHKGLVTFDRAYKKDAFYAYKAWLSDKPFVHIAGKRFTDRPGDELTIRVYSNLPEVELWRNGKRLATAKSDDHFFTFKVKNEGESRLVAKAGGYADELTVRKTEKLREDYILREAGDIINWFEIDTHEGSFSINDKISDIIRTKGGAALFEKFFGELASRASKKNVPDGAFELDLSNPGFLDMLGGFTPLRLSSMLKMAGITLKKEDLLRLNSELNKIEK